MKTDILVDSQIFISVPSFQLTYSSLTFFLTLYIVVFIILSFAKNIFLYFHIEIPLDIEHKSNIHENYVRSMHVLFPRDVIRPQNLCY